jgi:hypothetical protein
MEMALTCHIDSFQEFAEIYTVKELARKAALVINGVHVVPMGTVNAFLIEGDDGLTRSTPVSHGRRPPSSGRSAAWAIRQTSSST